MPHGPWMRVAITAAGVAILCLGGPAIAREAEKGARKGKQPARSYGQYLVEQTRTLHPELIGLDDWGYPIIDDSEVPRDLLGLARRAVDACPTLALLIEEE